MAHVKHLKRVIPELNTIFLEDLLPQEQVVYYDETTVHEGG